MCIKSEAKFHCFGLPSILTKSSDVNLIFQASEKKTDLSHKTKTQILDDLNQNVKEALYLFKDDPFLKDTDQELQDKTQQMKKTKVILEKYYSSVMVHIRDLQIEADIFGGNNSDSESEYEDDLDF